MTETSFTINIHTGRFDIAEVSRSLSHTDRVLSVSNSGCRLSVSMIAREGDRTSDIIEDALLSICGLDMGMNRDNSIVLPYIADKTLDVFSYFQMAEIVNRVGIHRYVTVVSFADHAEFLVYLAVNNS